VPHCRERPQVTPRPAAEVENRERRLTTDVRKKRSDVLTDVVIARTRPERVGAIVVVRQRETGDPFELPPPGAVFN